MATNTGAPSSAPARMRAETGHTSDPRPIAHCAGPSGGGITPIEKAAAMANSASARPRHPHGAVQANQAAISARVTGITHSLAHSGMPAPRILPCSRLARISSTPEYASTASTDAATQAASNPAIRRARSLRSSSAVERVRCVRWRVATSPPTNVSQSVTCCR